MNLHLTIYHVKQALKVIKKNKKRRKETKMGELDSQLDNLLSNRWKVAYDDLSLETRSAAEAQPQLSRKQQTGFRVSTTKPMTEDSHDDTIRKWNRTSQGSTKTTAAPPKKSQSVPPPHTRPMDCLDCSTTAVMEPVPPRSSDESSDSLLCPCDVARRAKRKETQDSLLHEHDRKFVRSCSLQLEAESATALRMFRPSGGYLVLESETVNNNNNNNAAGLPLQEVNEKQNQFEALATDSLAAGGKAEAVKRRVRRRKRHRRDSSSSAEATKENQDKAEALKAMIAVSSTPTAQTNQQTEEHDEYHRRNALNFLYGSDRTTQQEPVTRAVSSPLPAVESPPAALSAEASPRQQRSNSTPSSDCWVSQRLAHIMAVETPKETMMNMVDTDSPRTLNLINSNRFVEMNGGSHMMENTRGSGSATEQFGPEKTPRTKQLTKQLSNLKKKIEALEQQFMEVNGYRPSHQDKVNSAEMKCLVSEYAKLKREYKNEKENNVGEEKTDISRRNSVSPVVPKTIEQIMAKRTEIMTQLDQNRVSKNRPTDVTEMSIDHILEEKLEMHMMLREYEKEFGHPDTREEKDAMKEVYERYRVIKRMARRSSISKASDAVGDLITIPEEAEVDLTLASPAARINLQVTSCHVTAQNHTTQQLFSRHAMDLPDFVGSSEPANSTTKPWHAMSREELNLAAKTVREEKKIARRAVKEFEDRFSTLTGRKVTKEDREPLEKTYTVYKTSKSKLKLINALLSKSETKTRNNQR